MLTSTTVRNTFTGNGSTTIYTFTFKCYDQSWVKGLVNGAEAGGTVALNADQDSSPGGTFTFTTAPANGAAVEVVRDVPATQEVDYQAGGAFSAEVHERALDKLTMLAQQLDEKVSFVPQRWDVLGDGSTDTFDIDGATLQNNDFYIVTVNGVVLSPTTDFVVAPGDPWTITFTTPPAVSAKVVVRCFGYQQ
jgi:archaellum component FlaF (FlaF/FlaG flagellin family)